MTRALLSVILCLLCLLEVNGQTILVQPYLQNATETSMVVMWETNNNTETKLFYGTTVALELAAQGTTLTTLGSTILHTVSLTNLAPNTRYYYKAQTGSWSSAVYDFVTPPLRASEEGLNIVLMSDMQKDGSNPNIFHNLINNSLLPYIAANYGTPLSDHLQMAILPGDVVDVGSNYLQYKNDFFIPGQGLWRHVPSYPAIGNHEANSANYFNYFNLPWNGISGYKEHWYAHDYSNVRVLSFDSNNPYRIAAQLAWLDSILAVSCTDPLIDFVFAQMHHPYKSELWTPGETDFTGDIVERLETFSNNCNKPSVHFFGHTHAYSRGQSRDHKHLWVNVATSGGNIDYWGEFENEDYEEFVISQDEYGFVMVEVTAGANPKFTMKRLSFGDQFNPGGSTQTDLVTVYKNSSPPSTPVALYPRQSDTVSATCVTLRADGFYDPDQQGHGSSHWQISTDSSNYSNPAKESWKQHMNWYNEINTQANDTLNDELINNLPSGTTLFWRVRYRDKGLNWSNWSIPSRFRTQSLDTITTNLVINPGAESGISNWTATVGVIESLNPLECAGINPYQGQKYFAIGALCVEHPFASAYQNISVSTYATQIDAGNVLVNFGAYMADYANTDEPSFALQFLNGSNVGISGTDTTRHKTNIWTLKQKTFPVPPGTRTIKFIVMGTRFNGTDNDSYIDQLFLRLLQGDVTCSEYEPPGPVHKRIYVDKNAEGYPDGENWITAYRTVGDALRQNNQEPVIEEIWIADGSYIVTNDLQRDSSILISNAVSIYGGFSGNEILITQRNPSVSLTTLSGEIGNPNDITDNSHHVIRIMGNTDTVRLDGLHICCGNAAGDLIPHGAGLISEATNTHLVEIINCHFDKGHADEGNAIYNLGKLSISGSILTNLPGSSQAGSVVYNSGVGANLHITDTQIIQACIQCGEIVRNVGGAVMKVSESVSIERN